MAIRLSKSKVIVIATVAGISYLAYQRMMPQMPGGWPGADGAAPVSVAEVIVRDVQKWHEFSGRLTAVDHVEIRPRVSGTIDKVHFENGELVEVGEKLFTIDPRPYEAALQAASARAELAEAELKRARTLFAEKAIPQREYDQRKNDAAVARAELATAKLNLQYTQITAPISGRVGRAEITQGNLVETAAGAPVLTTIVSSDPIYLDFEIDEGTYLEYAQSDALAGEQTSEIPVAMALAGENGFPHKGHIEAFDNQLDEASGTIRVRAEFDNPKAILVPGLFARVRIGETGDSKTILITDRAVGTDQDKRFVLVVTPENKTEYREVKLGAMADGLRIVHEGLKPGEKIVVNGLQRTRPGQPVTPEIVSMDAKDNPQDVQPAAGSPS